MIQVKKGLIVKKEMMKREKPMMMIVKMKIMRGEKPMMMIMRIKMVKMRMKSSLMKEMSMKGRPL